MDKSTQIAPRVLAPALLAEHGILAPSPHNTQPWRVSLSENSLEIRPDHSRRLVADVTGRELYLALGCFWGTLRMAARGLGKEIVESIDGEVVRIAFRGTSDGDPAPELINAIRSRRNNRFPLQGPVDVSIVKSVELRGLEVHFVDDASLKRQLASITASAFKESLENRQFRREFADWVRPNSSRATDGIPGYALGFPTIISYIMPFVMKWFSMSRVVPKRDQMLSERAPALLTICGNDEIADWIQAGRVFAEMAILLECDGVTTAVNQSAIETPPYDVELQSALHSEKHALLFARCGRPSRSTKATPRRALGDLLEGALT